MICIPRTARYVCRTKSSRNSRKCRKHEQTSTYTAVRDFPLYVLKTKWYIYHELPGVWYELKHKQQKMPEARANMCVYSSTRFSGIIFEDEKTVPYDDTKNCIICDTKSDRPPCFVLRKGPSMPRRNWSIRREEPRIEFSRRTYARLWPIPAKP